MRAVRVVRHGEPADAIEVRDDVDVPEPGPGQVRVAVAAASLNFGDIARCRGGVAAVMAQPPFTLGMDVAGVVEAAGDGAEEWIGRRVVGISPQSLGGLAEQALAGSVFEAPPELDDAEAAAFTLPFHVSYLALHERAALQPGETVLVRGGASAVGTAAIQLGPRGRGDRHRHRRRPGEGRLCARARAPRSPSTTPARTCSTRSWTRPATAAPTSSSTPSAASRPRRSGPAARSAGATSRSGFNDDPESGLTGRPLRKLSMANMSVLGVLLAYLDTPRDFRRFGINAFPPETGERVHAALLDLVAPGQHPAR